MKKLSLKSPTFVLALSLATIILVLPSCSSTRSMPVVQRSDTTSYVQRSATHDTIYLHDSVYIREVLKGDTVYLTRTQYRDRWHERIRHDSIYLTRTDTIAVTSPQPLTWWQQTRIHVGDIAILILVLFIIYRLFICYLKKKVSWL